MKSTAVMVLQKWIEKTILILRIKKCIRVSPTEMVEMAPMVKRIETIKMVEMDGMMETITVTEMDRVIEAIRVIEVSEVMRMIEGMEIVVEAEEVVITQVITICK